MKKFLSILLSAIMMFSFSIIGFAKENVENVKNVDNTFDHFTPGSGKRAPANWYDPYCYDEEGHIKPDVFYNERCSAIYCNECHKIFTCLCLGRTSDGKCFFPYETTYINERGNEMVTNYCPYCGEKIINYDTHQNIDGVIYGSYCTDCGEFNGWYTSTHNPDGVTPLEMWCTSCGHYYTPTSLIRFISPEQMNADYSFIFEETAYQFGDGHDRSTDELVNTGLNYKLKKDVESNKPSFFQKFFSSIGNFFKAFINIFKWIGNIFK